MPVAGPTRPEKLRAIHCLAADCQTLTARGLQVLDDLIAGDLVLTRDQGFRPLLWVGRLQLAAERFRDAPHLSPVRIASGALGGGMPERDMLVSPQHRLLICGAQSLARFGEHEVLIPAIHLVGLPGISRLRPATSLSYIQLVFAEHQVIRCNGTWCESFQPTPAAVKGLDPDQRAQLLARLSMTSEEEGYGAARRSLKREESRLLFAQVA